MQYKNWKFWGNFYNLKKKANEKKLLQKVKDLELQIKNLKEARDAESDKTVTETIKKFEVQIEGL